MNPKYTPGGSTGGESALLYMKGSLMGWGTDIGGSIRIPAHMMGLYGLKPSVSLRILLLPFLIPSRLTLNRVLGSPIMAYQSPQRDRNMCLHPLGPWHAHCLPSIKS